MGQTGTIPNLVARTDEKCLGVVAYEHLKIHDGEMWSYTLQSALSNDGVKRVNYILTGAKEVHLSVMASGLGAGFLDVFEGPTVTVAGAAQVPVCRNRIVTPTPLAMALYLGPTSSADGTLLSRQRFGDGNNAGSTERTHEWVLKPATKYLIVLESDSANNIMEVAMDFYEEA